MLIVLPGFIYLEKLVVRIHNILNAFLRDAETADDLMKKPDEICTKLTRAADGEIVVDVENRDWQRLAR